MVFVETIIYHVDISEIEQVSDLSLSDMSRQDKIILRIMFESLCQEPWLRIRENQKKKKELDTIESIACLYRHSVTLFW